MRRQAWVVKNCRVLLVLAVLAVLWVWLSLPTFPLMPEVDGGMVQLRSKEQRRGGVMLLEGYNSNTLSLRVLCALESAARAHPTHQVTLFMTAQKLRSSALLQKLQEELTNVRLRHLDPAPLFTDTPLEAWYRRRSWTRSKWPQAHFNDALRWLLLWRYGGIYLDLDVLVLRPLHFLGNFTGLESGNWTGAGVVGFTPAHPLVGHTLNYLARHYDPSVWGSAGPKLLTRVLQQRCGMQLPSGNLTNCPDMRVLPCRAFYPVPWWEWRRYMQDDAQLSSDLLTDEDVYAVHVWNNFAQHVPLILPSDQPFARAALAVCPITVAHAPGRM